MTYTLWRSRPAAAHSLPSTWLAELMSKVKVHDPDDQLCATRRSAGVPFFVQVLTDTSLSTPFHLCTVRYAASTIDCNIWHCGVVFYCTGTLTLTIIITITLPPRDGSVVVRMDPLRFLVGCRTRRLNQVYFLFYILACFILYCCLLGPIFMYC